MAVCGLVLVTMLVLGQSLRFGGSPLLARNNQQRLSRSLVAVQAGYLDTLPQSDSALRTLYPATPHIGEGFLDVGDGHRVYYREYGSSKGLPALFLHGGPGAGCYPNHARFFDPQVYRIILVDQRGCGRSTPTGGLSCTQKLVNDLELIRNHLEVDQWRVLLGGSWGVTLALAYAQANPSRVYALVLRGVCLMRSLEIDYIFGDGAEAGLLNPVPWQRFVEYTGMDPATLKPGGRELLSAYCDRLLGDDVEVRSTAARAWSSWENSIFGWRPAQETPAYLAIKELLPATPRRVLTWDGQQWFLPGTDSTPEAASAIAAQIDLLKQLPEPSSPQPETSSSTTIVGQAASAVATAAVNASVVARDKLGKLANSMNRSKWMPVQNMLTAHYSRSNGFMDDAALLDGVACLRAAGVHGRAIQGGYDSICPPRTAMELHEAWPELEMRVVLEAGHSMYDPGITSEIVKATDNFRERRE